MTIMTIKRSGHVWIKVDGPNHCGESATSVNLGFDIQLTCAAKLDARGFLFNQAAIADHMMELGRVSFQIEPITASCEELALTLLSNVKEWAIADNPECKIKSISITLSPHNQASINVQKKFR